MRKLLLLAMTALIAMPTIALAGGGHHGGRHGGGHHGGHHGYRHHGYNSNWVVPAIVGGALVYGATRPNYYYTAPVYSYPPLDLGPPRVIVQNITPVAYWCEQGDGYFPQVQSCSDWQVVTK